MWQGCARFVEILQNMVNAPCFGGIVLNSFYRPQRSWAKVMFLQASVILSTGGVYLICYRGGTWSGPRGVYLVWSRGSVPGLVPGVYLVWSQGGVPGLVWGVYLADIPPGPGTSPQNRYTPQDQVHLSRDQVQPPRTRSTPPDQVPPTPNTANERPVRILLECILVLLYI